MPHRSLTHVAVFAAVSVCGAVRLSAQAVESEPSFVVWATSCAHVSSDAKRGRESLARAIRQSEGQEHGAPSFPWDVMIDAGDNSASDVAPSTREGKELLRQYRALERHRREQIYSVQGNHDAPYFDEGPGSWFRRFCDPFGTNTVESGVDPSRRPFAPSGTWERYSFQAGNILFLMLSDRNDVPSPVGRGQSSERLRGGCPSGAVTRETFDWWKDMVLANRDKIIVTMHHHALRDTTTASGSGEGGLYHPVPDTIPGASYLYYVIEDEDPARFRFTEDAHVFEDFLDRYHAEHGSGAIDLWIAGHTHVHGPNDRVGGKSITARRWGVTFFQTGALTQFHSGSAPMSRVLEFTDGRSVASARVYLHEDFGDHSVGFHAPTRVEVPLRHPFSAPPRLESVGAPFPAAAKKFAGPYFRELHPLLFVSGGPSPDLTGGWDPEAGGAFELERKVAADTANRIDRKPRIVPAPEPWLEFRGEQRLRVGSIDVDGWKGLSVSVWVRIDDQIARDRMHILGMDRICDDGCFRLVQRRDETSWQVWDPEAECWRSSAWRSEHDGEWRHIVAFVDPERSIIGAFEDGEAVSVTSWNSPALRNPSAAEFVVGADSGERRCTNLLFGDVRDVRLFRFAVGRDQARELAAGIRPR